MCDFSRVSAWFCDEKISLKKVVSTFTSGGDMSIVGPRPMPWGTVDSTYYGKYQKILSVRPGLTSAASLRSLFR